MQRILQFTVLLILSIILFSCAPNHRIAEHQTIPVFNDKNEICVSAALDLRTSGTVQLGYALSPHFYLNSQFSYHQKESSSNSSLLGNIDKQATHLILGIGVQNLWNQDFGIMLSSGWMQNSNSFNNNINNTQLGFTFVDDFAAPRSAGNLKIATQSFKITPYKSWKRDILKFHLGCTYNLDYIKSRKGALIYQGAFSGNNIQRGNMYHYLIPFSQMTIGPERFQFNCGLSYNLDLGQVDRPFQNQLVFHLGMISTFSPWDKEEKAMQKN